MTKKTIAILLAIIVIPAASYVTIRYYSFIFAKVVKGQIVQVERVNPDETTPPTQTISFAIAIQDSKNEIHTASSNDRQWAVARRGQCVEAKYFPYEPWNLERAGTFRDARLIRLYECPQQQSTHSSLNNSSSNTSSPNNNPPTD